MLDRPRGRTMARRGKRREMWEKRRSIAPKVLDQLASDRRGSSEFFVHVPPRLFSGIWNMTEATLSGLFTGYSATRVFPMILTYKSPSPSQVGTTRQDLEYHMWLMQI